jgi:hypothetical protein
MSLKSKLKGTGKDITEDQATKILSEMNANIKDLLDVNKEQKEIDSAQLEIATSGEIDDTAVKKLISDEEARAIAAEADLEAELIKTNAAIAAILENNDEVDLNSIKELASWITAHGTEASGMVEAIGANTTAIAAINNETTGILAVAKKYTDDQVAGLPAATVESLGLVKFDDTTIKMNDSKQLYVAQVSTDVLVQGADELVLNGGSAK